MFGLKTSAVHKPVVQPQNLFLGLRVSGLALGLYKPNIL